jgi:hypothetical protein
VCSDCDPPYRLGHVTLPIAERLAAPTGHLADDVALAPIGTWFAIPPSDEPD